MGGCFFARYLSKGGHVLCASCGADNLETAEVCNGCGKPLASGHPEDSTNPPSATDEVATASAEATEEVEQTGGNVAPIEEPEVVEAQADDSLFEADVPVAAETPQASSTLTEAALPAAHPKFAPPSLEQAATLVETEKHYPWISIPVGVFFFVVLLLVLGWADKQGTYFIPVSIVGAAAIYLATQFYLLPLFRPAVVRCPHCGKDVPMAKEALPRALWPWACPHCRQPLVAPRS